MWPFKKKPPVFCKDCVHFRPSATNAMYHKCAKTPVLDLVTARTRVLDFCDVQRASYGDCGLDGKYFKRKEEVV